jgi:hypothetical protein
MPAPSSLPKLFEEWGGVDRRANSVNRRTRFAEVCENNIRYLNNSFGVRQGVGIKFGYDGGGGLTAFVYQKEGVRYQKKITIDDNLYEILDGTITINYTGAAVTAQVKFYPSETFDGTWTLEVLEDAVIVYTDTFNNGVDQASVDLASTLASDIHALADWTAVYSGGAGAPAAAIGLVDEVVGASGLVLTIQYPSQIYCPTTNPFSAFWADKNTEDWQIADMLEHGNRLIIATGYGKLYKYDSVSCYAAGLPIPTSHTPAAIAGGALAVATYTTFIDYEIYDALGNYVQSEPGDFKTVSTSGANLQIQHTVGNIEANSGYLTSCAIVNGAQAGVTTITVDAAHTLQIGQTAYFYDAVSASYVEREITAIGATTITIAGANVTVADNAVISANLRINIWRNRNGGSLPYLVATIPNNSFAATQTFTDNVADAALEIEYEEAFESREPPPEDIKYLTAIQNNLLGATGKDDIVSFTQVDGPEAWSSSFLIRSKSNEAISGLGSNQEVVAVFKKTETHVVVGSLDDNRFRQEMLADDIGTDSHHSICDVSGTLWFYSSLYGFRRLRGTNSIEDVGYRVFPDVVVGAATQNPIAAKRVVAVVFKEEQLVLFHTPVEDSTGSERYPNDQSKVYVCDYSRQFEEDNEYDVSGRLVQQLPKTRWWPWTNFNFHGGACVVDGRLLFSERRYNSSAAAIEFFVSVYQQNNSIYDYNDHALPFSMEYAGGWEDLNEPELNKKWIKASIFSFGQDLADSFTLLCSVETNLVNEVSRASKELSFGGEADSSGWGYPAWGDFAWGDSQDARTIFSFPPLRATSLRLRFTKDVYNEAPVISGWVYQVVPVYRPKIARDR